MADRSPIFNPPMDRITDNDPMIVRVPMEKADWGARRSQQKAWNKDDKALKHIPNGR